MISLDEQTQTPTLKTNGELHRSLIGFHGRLIRIRQYRVDMDPYMGGFYDYDEDYEPSSNWTVNSSDSLGRLQALQLQDNSTVERNSPMPKLINGSLTVVLEGVGSLLVELQRSLVEVFQEDSGRWIGVHRGVGYPQETVSVEKAA